MPYSVYIDEAGDLGIGKGTQWFIISAIAIERSEELNIRKTMQSIKNKLNLNTIHFRDIKDHSKRLYIVSSLAQHDFTYFNVICDTRKLKLHNSNFVYNYLCRLLIERTSWFIRDLNDTADIMLSSRGTSRDEDLKKYIQDILLNDYNNQVAKIFNKVSYQSSPKWDMLQLADICATRMFYSYEQNKFDFTIPCYAKLLKNKLYHYNDRIIKYGIKYFSDDMKPSDLDIICK